MRLFGWPKKRKTTGAMLSIFGHEEIPSNNAIALASNAHEYSPRERYENVHFFASSLCGHDDGKGRHPLFALMRMYVDKINYRHASDIISTNNWRYESRGFWGNLFEPVTDIFSAVCRPMNLPDSVRISLVKDSVLARVHESSKLSECVKTYGDEPGETPWELHGNHRCAKLYLPFGITEMCSDGNHTAFTGLLKRTGEIELPAGSDKVLDLSRMFELLTCDGEYFYWRTENGDFLPRNGILGETIKKGEVFAKVGSFDGACLFAIGSVILSNRLAFKNIPFDEYQYNYDMPFLQRRV